MAYTSGTAANYKDLLAVLATFAAANGWSIMEQSETVLYLKGSGIAGLDEIYCGVETYEVPTSGIYNWNMYGSIGYRSGRAPSKHPGSSYTYASNLVVACLWNTAIPYWMVANGRRIILVAKVGTTYQTIHLGLLTPPATDAQYPYPLLIGGCRYDNTTSYSSTYIGSFWGSYGDDYASGRIYCPSGVWGILSANSSSNNEYCPAVSVDNVCKSYEGTIITGLDGSYLLEPVYITMLASSKAILGHVEGLFRITGHANTSENIVTVDGVNYLVFQDCSRSGYGDFCCMRMN